VAPKLSSGWQHNYSTKTRQAGRANEQSMYSLMSMSYTDAYNVRYRDTKHNDTLHYNNNNSAKLIINNLQNNIKPDETQHNNP
jgi:hypothetical protein